MPPRPTAATRRWSRAFRDWQWWLELSLTSNHRDCERKRSSPSRSSKKEWIASSLSLLAMTTLGTARLTSLLQILLHLGAQAVAKFGARHAVGDVGAQEARLRAAIVPLALELHAVEFLRLGKADHRVGELDLAAGAALLGFENLENLRLQDVAPGDREIGRRGTLRRLFHHAVDLEHL